MRIYLCTPENFFTEDSAREKLRLDLCEALKNFYGPFPSKDIEFFSTNDSQPCLYIMEGTLKKDSDREVVKAVNSLLPSAEVKLNYQRLDPNFYPGKPEAPAKPFTPSPSSSSPSPASPSSKDEKSSEEFNYKELAKNYQAEAPHFTFEQVILPEATREKIKEAVATIQVEEKVFDQWGLRKIIPYAASAVTFYGLPGTGKTMAAEAVAAMIGKKIIRATYADIESKYHGEGPKRVKAIFYAAQRDDAVLFLDEADSLLSKRLTDVSHGSEQAINSMRSQLLISLEHFRGIVIFSTNLIINYDQAFLSRLIKIDFPMPDSSARKIIWEQHLRGDGIKIPLAGDIDTETLARRYSFSGRDIKNAVKDACVTVAMHNSEPVTQKDLIKSCEKVKEEAEKIKNASDHTKNSYSDKKILSPELKNSFANIIKEQVKARTHA